MRQLLLRRAFRRPALPLALLLVVAAGATVLATLGLGGRALLDDGVRNAVAAAPPAQRGVQVSVRLDEDAAAQDVAVRRALAETFGDVPAAVTTGLRSDPLVIDGQNDLVAEVFPDATRRARLAAGRWPSAGPEGALQADAAAALGVGPGDTLTVGGPDARRTLLVTGTWRADPADPAWFGDPLELTGSERARRGPFLMVAGERPPDVGVNWTARWRALPDPDGLRASDLPRLARAVRGLDAALEGVPAGGAGVPQVAGGLGATLEGPLAALPRIRAAAVALLAIALGLVAALCVQCAALLAADRATESAYLVARGTSRRQRLGLAAGEAFGVSAVAVLPALAVAAQAGGAAAGIVAAVTACAAVGLVLLLTQQVLTNRGGRGRRGAWPATLAVTAVLAVAGWQLWRARAGDQGPTRWVVDPVLAVAPVVVLVAGAVLVVRALGAVVGVLGVLARSRRAVPALAGWSAARRGTSPAAPLVALALVAAIAVLTVSARSTIAAAAADRTAAELGGDVVLTGAATGSDPRAGLAATPGVAAVTAVQRRQVAAGSEEVELLALEAGRAAAVTDGLAVPVAGRPDAGAAPGGIPLSAGELAVDLALTLEADENALAELGILPNAPLGPPPPVSVRALLGHADGSWTWQSLGQVPADGRVARVRAALPAEQGLRLAGLEVGIPTDAFVPLTTSVDVRALTVGGAPLPEASRWSAQLIGAAPQTPAPVTEPDPPGAVLARVTLLGAATSPMRLLPDPPEVPAALPAVVATGTAERLGIEEGAQLQVNLRTGGPAVPVQVAAIAPRLPGGRPAGLAADAVRPLAPPAPDLLVDLPALQAIALVNGQPALPPTAEWWAAGDPSPGALPALRQGTAETAAGVLERRLVDPFARGLRDLLVLTLAAAIAVAVGVVLLGDVVLAGRRRREYAALRAIGLSARQVRRTVAVERIPVGLGAVLAGAALGFAVAGLVVPALTGLPAAQASILDLDLPWAFAAIGVPALAVLLGAVAAARVVARTDPASAFREAES